MPASHRTFNTYMGLRQHLRKSHPVEYNRELENKYEQDNRETYDDEEDLMMRMAEEEAKYEGPHANKHLRTLFPHLTIDQIKYRRSKAFYQENLTSIKTRNEALDLVQENEPLGTDERNPIEDDAVIVDEQLVRPTMVGRASLTPGLNLSITDPDDPNGERGWERVHPPG